MPRAGTPPPRALTETVAAGPPPSRREDPIAEAAVRARERLRRQREIAVEGLEAVAAEEQGELPQPEPFEGAPAPVPKGDVADLRDEVDALRRDLQEAVAQMSRDIERAERLAADRARKEARRQGRKSERAARRAARAAMDTPEDPP